MTSRGVDKQRGNGWKEGYRAGFEDGKVMGFEEGRVMENL